MPRKTRLQKTFEDFNHRFFGDRLYDVEVSWAKGKTLTVDGDKVCGYAWDASSANLYNPQKIVLARYLKKCDWMWQLVLIHEMCHIDLDLSGSTSHHDHDEEFNAAMLKLSNMGALVGIW